MKYPKAAPVLLLTLSVIFISVLRAEATSVTWSSAVPYSTRVEVLYDFRPTIFGQANLITPAEEAVAIQALQLWSQVSNLTFVQSTTAPASRIIDIGVSPLDSTGMLLGEGGYSYTVRGGTPHIAGGVADMNAYVAWSDSVNTSDPAGTVNFFSVAAHEIGHALGLDHSANAQDIMYPYYTGDKFTPSSTDIANIQALYGGGLGTPSADTFSALTAVPEPSTLVLCVSGLLALGFRRLCSHPREDDVPSVLSRESLEQIRGRH